MSVTAAAPAGGNALKNLRTNTRQRFQRVGNPLNFTGFQQTLTLQMPQVGYLSRLHFVHNFTVTDSAASPSVAADASGRGPWNLIKRIVVSTNLGTSSIFDVSGFGAHVFDRAYNTDISTGSAYGTADTVDPLYAYPVSGYTQNVGKSVNFTHFVPIAINDGDQFSMGMINLQAPEIIMTISVTTGSASDILSTSDSLTLSGTTNVYESYYEVPSPGANVAAPARILHRVIEDSTPIQSAGDNIYTVQRQGRLLRLFHWFLLNNIITSKVSDVTNIRLVANTTDTIYNKDTVIFLQEMRLRYGHLGLPLGVYVWDFFNATENPNRGDLRDVFDTQAVSVLESHYTLASNVSLGASGTNTASSLRQILQGY